jgi:hypothetical protein
VIECFNKASPKESAMTTAARYGCSVVAGLILILSVACSDQLSAARCEANSADNQQALVSINRLLAKNKDNMRAIISRP